MSSKLAIVVQTCDRYSDIWNGFYTLLNRYWGGRSYPVYHVTETKKVDEPGVLTILTGEVEWSARLLYALDRIDADYVLLLLEDYYLTKPVNEVQINSCIEILRDHPNAASLRIFPVPGPDIDISDKIGLIQKGSQYALSTQATIWRSDALKKMLVSSETVWDFEFKGSQRISESSFDLLSVKINHKRKAEEGDYPYTYLCTAVYKGKWMKEAVELCKKENIPMDLTHRRVETTFENFYRKNYNAMPVFVKHGLDYLRHRLND